MAVTLIKFLGYLCLLYFFFISSEVPLLTSTKNVKPLTKIAWSVGRNDVLTKMNFPLNVDDILL